MKRLSLAVVCVLAAVATGACGSPLTFVKRAPASALKGASTYSVRELTYEGLRVGNKTEGEYLADRQAKAEAKGKEDASEEKWEDNKATWKNDVTNLIASQLKLAGLNAASMAASAAPSSGIVIATNVEFIEPGFYAVMMARPSQTMVRVKIYDASKPSEILYEFTSRTSHSGFSTGGRVRDDMVQLANRIAAFLVEETRG